MKINTLLKYNSTADIYVPRVDINGITSYVLYDKNRNLPINVVSGRTSSVIFTPEAVEYAAQALQVRSPEGRLLFIEDTDKGIEEYGMYVHSVLPVVDIYGTITGYRSILKRVQPVLGSRPSSDGG